MMATLKRELDVAGDGNLPPTESSPPARHPKGLPLSALLSPEPEEAPSSPSSSSSLHSMMPDTFSAFMNSKPSSQSPASSPPSALSPASIACDGGMSPKLCAQCGRSQSPCWRRGPNRTMLCNSCGLKHARRLRREKEGEDEPLAKSSPKRLRPDLEAADQPHGDQSWQGYRNQSTNMPIPPFGLGPLATAFLPQAVPSTLPFLNSPSTFSATTPDLRRGVSGASAPLLPQPTTITSPLVFPGLAGGYVLPPVTGLPSATATSQQAAGHPAQQGPRPTAFPSASLHSPLTDPSLLTALASVQLGNLCAIQNGLMAGPSAPKPPSGAPPTPLNDKTTGRSPSSSSSKPPASAPPTEAPSSVSPFLQTLSAIYAQNPLAYLSILASIAPTLFAPSPVQKQQSPDVQATINLLVQQALQNPLLSMMTPPAPQPQPSSTSTTPMPNAPVQLPPLTSLSDLMNASQQMQRNSSFTLPPLMPTASTSTSTSSSLPAPSMNTMSKPTAALLLSSLSKASSSPADSSVFAAQKAPPSAMPIIIKMERPSEQQTRPRPTRKRKMRTYQCRSCQLPKKGHICPVLSTDDQPSGKTRHLHPHDGASSSSSSSPACEGGDPHSWPSSPSSYAEGSPRCDASSPSPSSSSSSSSCSSHHHETTSDPQPRSSPSPLSERLSAPSSPCPSPHPTSPAM